MKELLLPQHLAERVRGIYEEMAAGYDAVAEKLDFSCRDCPDNCCDSYFQHHTYVEWAYLWLGFGQLPVDTRQEILQWAENYIQQCTEAQSRGERPQVMCPLNKDGLCMLYQHRLLVCRTHGVPATMRRPDGQVLRFPGCFRCQEVVGICNDRAEVPHVDRTALLRQLVLVENELLENRRHLYPKVKLTIAEMLVKGPPVLPCIAKNSQSQLQCP